MKLGDISAAYLAYENLGRLPKNAPEFAYTAKGYPILHFGERYCRAIHLVTGGICGQAFQTKPGLENHLGSVHGFTQDKKPALVRKHSVVQYKEAASFYEELMKHETYDHKAVERHSLASTAQRSLEDDQHDDADDDEILVKRRIPTQQKPVANRLTIPSPGETDQKTTRPPVKKPLSVQATTKTRAPMPESKDNTFKTLPVDIPESKDSTLKTLPVDGDGDMNEEELELELEKVEEEEKLRRTVLKKLELKRKLALLRKRRQSR